jgi:hypothetical protein
VVGRRARHAVLWALAALALGGCQPERPARRTPPPGAVAAATGSPAAEQPTSGGARVRGAASAVAAPTPDAWTAQLRTAAPVRDLVDLAVRMGRATGPVSRTRAGPPPSYHEGDHETFWVHDIQSERYFEVPATLQVLTDQAYFWVQDGQSFDPDKLRRGATAFSNEVVPAVRAVFGREWSPGVDGDPRVHLLHHQPIGGVAGYFSSTDEFTREVEPFSNEREMFYVNLAVHDPGSFDYLSLLAHEYQHMIHWNADRGEAVWVNEGLSELAAQVAGYQQQFGDEFLRQPDTALDEWETNTGANAPHYAAAYLFFAYLRAQYGDEAIRAIVASPASGAAGVEEGLAAVGLSRSFDDVFQDWVVANLVDDAVRAGGRYSYREDGISRVEPGALEAGGVEASVGQYASDYYDLTPLVKDGALALDFAGDATVGLLDAVDDSNGTVWWSGRHDNGDSRLSRRFDLRGATSPRLDFRLWHDLEENWDYAYVLASTDGGRSWTRLSIPGGTDENPNGNGYGRGLTGASPGWVERSLDLSAFAGQEVELRFEVVTDDAVSMAGVALDDLRLDAVGFRDDATADAGWQAEGWTRLDPTLPQRWAVQLVQEQPGAIDVQRLGVSADGRAQLRRSDIPPDAKLTLVVSGLTPGTRHGSGYRLSPAAAATPR